MSNRAQQIAAQISALVDELVELSGATPKGTTRVGAKVPIQKDADYSGPTGGVRLLLSEGYFAQPRKLSEVIERLRQEGRHYRKTVVSNALIRNVRGRKGLTRIRGEKQTEWVYVERK